MLRFVIDASVAVKWFIPEPESEKAEILLAKFRRGEIDLAAPDVVVGEVGNTLWKRSARGDIAVDDAAQSYADLLKIAITIQSSSALALRAFKLASDLAHPLYDTLYIALAESLNCELVTADEALIKKLRAKFPLLRALKTIAEPLQPVLPLAGTP
jgi:predicted nucleic acid-binding protein